MAARQASLSITNSWSLLKLMPIESVMPSNHPPYIVPYISLELQAYYLLIKSQMNDLTRQQHRIDEQDILFALGMGNQMLEACFHAEVFD